MATKVKHLLNNKRAMAIVALIAILAITLFSSFYIVLEAEHDCIGKSCQICATITQCNNNLKQLGVVSITIVTLAIAINILLQAISLIYSTVSIETPITKKVRLNN